MRKKKKSLVCEVTLKTSHTRNWNERRQNKPQSVTKTYNPTHFLERNNQGESHDGAIYFSLKLPDLQLTLAS